MNLGDSVLQRSARQGFGILGGTFYFGRISSPVASPRRRDSAKQFRQRQDVAGDYLAIRVWRFFRRQKHLYTDSQKHLYTGVFVV